MQAFSVCFALSHQKVKTTRLSADDYDFWRAVRPRFAARVDGATFSGRSRTRARWSRTLTTSIRTANRRSLLGLWTYRRILDQGNFTPGFFTSDVSLVNVPQIDYLLGDICNATAEETRRAHIERAKRQSLSFLYWMQQEAPRPDGGPGFPGLRLRGRCDKFFRRSRQATLHPRVAQDKSRVHSLRTARGSVHSATEGRESRRATPDSVGIGYYRMISSDIGRRQLLRHRKPSVPNPARRADSATRRESAARLQEHRHDAHHERCYRLHPVEWNVGEAAGALAPSASHTHDSPRRASLAASPSGFPKTARTVGCRAGVAARHRPRRRRTSSYAM